MARFRRIVRFVRALNVEAPIHAVMGSMYAVETREPVVHLTYDDGPHPEVTPAVLDALDEFGAPATFFMLTREAERYPELVHEVRRRGHTVALHTRTHRRLSTLTWRELIDEVIVARRDLEAIAETEIAWFRPPYGAEGIRGVPVVRAGGMRTVGWSSDTHDWKGLKGEDPLRNARKNLEGGGIVLMHDVPATDSMKGDQAQGYISKDDLTRLLLTEVEGMGLRPVSLSALVAEGSVLKRARLA